MKLTLLGYVQNISSALSSDEVNSIGDTSESMQIAEIVKTSFFNIIARAGLPELKKLFQLEPSGSVAQPVLMLMPEGIRSIEWLKYYDADPSAKMYKYVTLLPVQQFSDYVNGYNTSDTNVDVLSLTINSENFLFNYKNDVTPHYATIISDYYIIFDSYNHTLDSTLESANTQAFGEAEPIWRMEDTFIPDIDTEQVPLLLNEAKSLAYFELKQTPHVKAEQEAKRQWSSLQKDKSIDNKPTYFDQTPNYGRIAAYRNRGPNFRWS